MSIKAKNYYDAKGKHVIPGLIDSHIHIESTLMTPKKLCKGSNTIWNNNCGNRSS